MRSAEWTHGSSNLLVNLAAAVVCAAGFGFAVWARRHIGRNWGVPMSVKAKTELVTTGPYGLVRHPIYSGILLALLGSAPIFGLRLIVVAVAFGAYAIYSATVEERNMESLFPGQYAEYRRRTKFLIPWIF